MWCGHPNMVGRLVKALTQVGDEIQEGKAYEVIGEFRNPRDKDDLKRVTVRSNSGRPVDLSEGEFE